MNQNIIDALATFAVESLTENQVAATIFEVIQTGVPQALDTEKKLWLAIKGSQYKVVNSHGSEQFVKRKLKDAINTYHQEFLLK